MTKQKDHKPGHGKILDAWIPPENAGQPIGCVATSFTFAPVLFEEECLGRFLQLETDATEDGPAYLVEREEKLAQLECAAALVDQHHAHGMRSLRWDLLPARVSSGILHAKVSLLLWSRCARLIVASANLTEDGYRRNHEVFGVLDFFAGSESPLPVLDAMVTFLREAVRYVDVPTGVNGPAIGRWNAFLDHTSAATRGWGLAQPPRMSAAPRVSAVVTGPDRASAFAMLQELWPSSSPPSAAFVISPFFDPPEASNEPARQLWTLLRQRGEATVSYEVTAEDVPGEKAILLHAPKSLLEAQPSNRSQVTTEFTRLTTEEGRPLHAKYLWLRNDFVTLSLIGSSNFTSAGLGLGETKNLEANLAFVVSSRDSQGYQAILDASLPTEEIPEDLEWRWQPRSDEGEDCTLTDSLPLHPAFGQATFGRDEHEGAFVELTFNGTPPSGWVLFPEDEREPFLGEAAWQRQNSPARFRQAWQRERPPSIFRVKWTDAAGCAWWPVNILDSTSLPPPAELRDLPLEILIDILTSTKSLHRALQRWLRRQKSGGVHEIETSIDPHKRVDTSAFLLQRTRRVSDALRALRLRLERPIVSQQALDWRLHGPVGPLALARAIGVEAKSEQERCFLLTELCLELMRVQPCTSADALSTAAVKAAIREIAQEIRASISPDVLMHLPSLATYTKAALDEVLG
jgi:hypothetical protein